MQRRDYIMRMIEQLGVAILRIRDMIARKATPAEIRSEMNATAASAGIDLEMAKLASPDTVLSLMSIGGEINPSRCWLTAELLMVDAMEAEAGERIDDALLSYEKALRLYGLLEPGGAFIVGWPEAATRAEEVTHRMKALGVQQ